MPDVELLITGAEGMHDVASRIHVTSLSRRRNTKIDISPPPVASSNVCIPHDFSSSIFKNGAGVIIDHGSLHPAPVLSDKLPQPLNLFL
ncbi:MAG TPA: hypothetical protein PK659_10190, partial [Methanothrix sp.]